MDFNIAEIDNRNTPRVQLNLPIKINNNKGETIDFNELGMGFRTLNKIEKRDYNAEIKLDSGCIDFNIEIIWSKKDKKSNTYIHGAKFSEINPVKLQKIRKKVIITKLKNTIKSFSLKADKKDLMRFSKEVLAYLSSLYHLSEKLDSGNMRVKNASEFLKTRTDKVMEEAKIFQDSINNKLLEKKAKKDFRDLTSSWAYKGFIVKRSFDKPRGYPGDFRIMEYIYDEILISKGIGQCFDVYFQNNEYAEAVRKRKDWMRRYLENFISEKNKKNINILNIACGSNREIRELLHNKPYVYTHLSEKGKKVILNLLDQDNEALAFSNLNLKSFNRFVDIRLLDNDIMDLTKENEVQINQSMDLIYTIGLADYLPDRILGKLLNRCVDNFLKKDGKLVIAHKDISRYRPMPPNWFCDWNFYSRNKDDLNNLLKKHVGFDTVDVQYYRDDTGIIIFAELTKIK
ncbi:MAG: hypothetical protein GF408_08395 [Candidatus Omnitrophica bacterium]|nr:hypothetical protein [Candidatus Omnitrophota bacterium]